ncbi:MAG: HEPN domain-containing protein [Chloroflexota bacterium]
MQALFVGQLINRRKLYSSELRQVLQDLRAYREKADYKTEWVTRREASRALRLAQTFVREIADRDQGEG